MHNEHKKIQKYFVHFTYCNFLKTCYNNNCQEGAEVESREKFNLMR